ncbi:MAG: hypothetical protein KBS56_04025 [Clostridiales bacterium]|nr:hypothetical protein [Candidatus Crickella equi]
MKRNSRIIAIIIAMLMVLSTSFVFAEEVQASEIKAYTVDYMFDLDDTVTEHTTIYYSDDMFAGSSSKYDEHLATTSMGLCLAAGYEKDINSLLSNMGFDGVKSNYSTKDAKKENIAFSYAKKELANGTILIPVVIRGSHYESEWVDNFNAGKSGDAKGYSSAASTVCKYINAYIKSLKTKKVKLWVVGYSRGAAVADLAAESLTKTYGKAKVYGYCFEGPMTNKGNGKKANIHHIRNAYDGVTLVLPSYMGFGTAGKVDAKIGDLSNESQMKSMLQKYVVKENVSSLYESPRDFAWAKMDTSVLLKVSKLPISELSESEIKRMVLVGKLGIDEAQKLSDIQEGKFPIVKQYTAETGEFWTLLLKKLKATIPSRKAYNSTRSANVKSVNGTTVEKSFMGIMKWYTSKNDSAKEAVQDQVVASLLNCFKTKEGRRVISKVLDPSIKLTMSKKEYKAVVNAFASGLNANSSFKKTIGGGLETVLKLLDKDLASDQQILASVLYEEGSKSNINKLIFPHGLEVTMAWLMIADSYYE